MKVGEVMKMQGADPEGSAAVGVMGVDGEDADAVAIIPVRDYGAFVKNFGGTGAGVDELKLDEKPIYVKNLDGGFAAVGPKKDLVEKFGGKPGNGKSHEALMGVTGKAIAESCDVVVVANIAKLSDKIKEGTQQFKDQMAMGMAMMGNAGDLSGVDKFMDSFLRDATAGILGFRVGESGVTFDAGAQFREGSELAGYLTSKGKAAGLLSMLPDQPFLFAMAMDSSGPGMQKLMKDLKAFGQKMQGGEGKEGVAGMFPTDWAEKSDGFAFQIGTSPAPVGGLFLNTVAYMKTAKPADMAKNMKDTITGMNGKTMDGVSFTTTYEEGVAAGSQKADAWSIKMQADPENPQADMLNQVNFMLFGPGGLGGYSVPTDGGVVLTYSKNSDLLAQAVASAKGGANMGTEAEVKKIAAALPADRSFEGYIGVKSLLDTALGVLGPAGIAPNVQVPDEIPPVGMGMTTHGGGFRMTLVVPTKVMTSIKTMVDSMDQGDGEKPDAGQPKF